MHIVYRQHSQKNQIFMYVCSYIYIYSIQYSYFNNDLYNINICTQQNQKLLNRKKIPCHGEIYYLLLIDIIIITIMNSFFFIHNLATWTVSTMDSEQLENVVIFLSIKFWISVSLGICCHVTSFHKSNYLICIFHFKLCDIGISSLCRNLFFFLDLSVHGLCKSVFSLQFHFHKPYS